MAEDWLIFRLKDGASGNGELGDAVMAPLGKKQRAEAEKLAGPDATVSEVGVRVSGASMDALQALAEKLEAKLGPIGIAQVRTTEWWDRADFAITRAPLG